MRKILSAVVTSTMPSTKRARGALASTTIERKRTANLCAAIGCWCDLPGSDGAAGAFYWLRPTPISICLISNHKAKKKYALAILRFFSRFARLMHTRLGNISIALESSVLLFHQSAVFAFVSVHFLYFFSLFFNRHRSDTHGSDRDRKGSTTYFGIWRNVQAPGNTQRVIHSVLDMARPATLRIHRQQKWL